MNHLKWMSHSATIMELQRSLHQDSSACDVIVIGNNNKVFRAHRFLLCFASDYFKEMFREIPVHQEVTVLLPDVRSSILKNILNFIYTGEVCVSSADLSDFLENINLLGIKSAISFECHMNKQKSLGKEVTIEPILVEEDEAEQPSGSQKQEEDLDGQQSTKDFDYLEVYNGDEKISQYTIEHSNNDYILAENTDSTFVLPVVKSSDNEITMKQRYVSEIQMEADYQESSNQTPLESLKSESPEKLKLESTQTAAPSRSVAFDAAVEDVLKFGASLQKAATKYNVSKTVLWRKVRKHPDYKIEREHPMLNLAIEMLEKGESLKTISHLIKIPISTLHRHKVRLLQEGRLPDHVQVKRRDSKDNLKERLADAIGACSRGMSQNQAANVYSVPKSTLWRHLQKHTLNVKIEAGIADEISISS